MRFSTRIAKIIFIITALVLLVIATILYIQVNDLVDDNHSVTHTNEVKLSLAQTLSSFKDSESAQRGYMLTKDSVFLQPYNSSVENARTAIDHLFQLTGSNKEQRENVKKLDTLATLRFSGFYTTINSFFGARSEIDRRQILLKEKSMMDSIRKQINKMESFEMRLMEKRAGTDVNPALFAPVATISLVFFSLAVLAFSYYRITLDLKLLEKNVDQMKSLNTELLEKNRQLEITNEELDSFNYISSHDLQEPARKIRTFISMIEEAGYDNLSEKNKHNFQRIQAAAIRIQELLQDLLTYSQLNKKNIDFAEIDLNHVLKKVRENLSGYISKTNAVIRNNQLPTINGIAFQMEQLFAHLIANSLKYKQPEVVPELQINYSIINSKEMNMEQLTKEHYHKISFIDNGVGFDQDQSHKIFELFTQLHNGTRYGGTGVGLTICKKIVQNHNGFIKAKSKINEGAVFEIYLPA